MKIYPAGKSKASAVLPVILITLLLAGACVPHDKIVYFQRDDYSQNDTILFEKEDYVISRDDILHVRVHTFDEETDEMFNKEGGDQQMRMGGGGNNMGMIFYLQGYSVTSEGNINLPVLGRVHVEGKTIEEATQQIEKELEEFIVGATVVVKLVNFSITVLGEVNRPGQYFIYDNRISVMDALGLTSDMSDFGNREVRVVRQTDQGAIFTTLDLKDPQVHASEFYFLRPNDVVYVEPYRVERLGFQTFPFALVFSTISTTLLLINFFSN